MPINDSDCLGYTAYDKVTRFRGVITARVEYLSGCIQILLSPPVGTDGKESPGHFFDVQRIELDTTAPRIILDKVKSPPGFQPGPIGRRELP